MRRIATALLATVSVASGAALATPAGAARSVPREFVGVVIDGPLTAPGSDLFAGQLGPMVRVGVESARIQFEWSRIQPYEKWLDVPTGEVTAYRDVDGIPTDFRHTDEWVGRAAARGIRVLPVLISPPSWAARHPGEPNSPPAHFKEYARFAGAMVDRYGSTGTYWVDHPGAPKLAIRDWQVWNEPHFYEFWRDEGWAREYVTLLKRAYEAIHDADPKAKVVMAGLANESWKYLDRIYKNGARGHFDYAAIHPFTRRVGGVIEILERARKVMKRRGDRRRPIVVTELSWTSARGKTDEQYGFEQSEKGQARQLRNAYRQLGENRGRLRLRGAYWYTWLTNDRSKVQPFDYAGVNKMRNGEVVRKPAHAALRRIALALEDCDSKGPSALDCDD